MSYVVEKKHIFHQANMVFVLNSRLSQSQYYFQNIDFKFVNLTNKLWVNVILHVPNNSNMWNLLDVDVCAYAILQRSWCIIIILHTRVVLEFVKTLTLWTKITVLDIIFKNVVNIFRWSLPYLRYQNWFFVFSTVPFPIYDCNWKSLFAKFASAHGAPPPTQTISMDVGERMATFEFWVGG